MILQEVIVLKDLCFHSLEDNLEQWKSWCFFLFLCRLVFYSLDYTCHWLYGPLSDKPLLHQVSDLLIKVKKIMSYHKFHLSGNKENSIFSFDIVVLMWPNSHSTMKHLSHTALTIIFYCYYFIAIILLQVVLVYFYHFMGTEVVRYDHVFCFQFRFFFSKMIELFWRSTCPMCRL